MFGRENETQLRRIEDEPLYKLGLNAGVDLQKLADVKSTDDIFRPLIESASQCKRLFAVDIIEAMIDLKIKILGK